MKVYNDLYEQIAAVPAVPGGRFPATFGHMMGGYDSGYYGYLWSKVYAEDMFTKFEGENILNPQVGKRYRKWILEKGNMIEAVDLLKKFLGREPSDKAFFDKLHIKQ